MTAVTRATSAVETPVYFESEGETLFGILTEPVVAPVGAGVVLMHGGNLGPSPGRNQMGVRLCRRMAELGYHALRFDYHGVGESTGSVERFRLDQPFTRDAEAALAWLRSHGLQRFVLIGGCFGARTALSCVAPGSGVVGIVLKALPVRDKEKDDGGVRPLSPEASLRSYARRAAHPRVLRRLTDAEKRRAYIRRLRHSRRGRSSSSSDRQLLANGLSPIVMSQLAGAIDQQVCTLLIAGTRDPGHADYARALSGPLGDLLQRAGSLANSVVLEGRVGAAADADLHEPVIEVIASWIPRLPDR